MDGRAGGSRLSAPCLQLPSPCCLGTSAPSSAGAARPTAASSSSGSLFSCLHAIMLTEPLPACSLICMATLDRLDEHLSCFLCKFITVARALQSHSHWEAAGTIDSSGRLQRPTFSRTRKRERRGTASSRSSSTGTGQARRNLMAGRRPRAGEALHTIQWRGQQEPLPQGQGPEYL